MLKPDLHIVPHFIAYPSELFDWLKTGIQWDERMKARRTASFGVAYNYSQIAYDAVPMPAQLDAVCSALAVAVGFRPNNCLVNLYPDGTSSMGFHSDEIVYLTPGTGVAIVSLGAVRSIVFRNKLDRAIESSYALESGSLLYMSQEVQHDWLHAIPKSAGAAERISLTFRSMQSAGLP